MDASHEAALQRLRQTMERQAWGFAPEFASDVWALLAALDAAGPLLAAAEQYRAAYDVWLANLDKSGSRGIEGERAAERLYDVDRARHLLTTAAYDAACCRVAAQQPPAASPATMGATEGE